MSRRMNDSFDIAVIGSGFGGSLMGMIARRLGRSVVLLERGRHPRFSIGESSTPWRICCWKNSRFATICRGCGR